MIRDEIIDKLNLDWDIVVIGGGITGAGIFNEASKKGYSVLLLEQRDFGWGTSSRSGKLVHGGLRYLGQGQIKTTWHCVQEREKLLKEYPNLVEPLRFFYPAYEIDRNAKLLKIGLTIYDLMAGRRDYTTHDYIDTQRRAPSLSSKGLKGSISFTDAKTDDARLVLRIISEGKINGGTALNYMVVDELLKDNQGKIRGVVALDKVSGQHYEIKSQVVINATEVFVDNIRSKINKDPILRKLRGSHIIFPHWRFPIYQAISFNHPDDNRPLYMLPWQGATLFGTTDIEHEPSINDEPKISREESEYLFSALDFLFPSLKLTKADAISTFSGIRPVLNTGKENPSKESRDHVILSDNGLITVTGGKLTTFRILALEALKTAKIHIKHPNKKESLPIKKYPNHETINSNNAHKRLEQIFGENAINLIQDEELMSKGHIDNTDILWAELIWSARNEDVIHLEDLMLRRSRIGLISPNGGKHLLDKIGEYLEKDLGYDTEKFKQEKENYLKLWKEAYSPELL